jgi:hypothetical protein
MNVTFSTNYMFNGRKAKIFSKNGWRKPEEEERGFTVLQ